MHFKRKAFEAGNIKLGKYPRELFEQLELEDTGFGFASSMIYKRKGGNGNRWLVHTEQNGEIFNITLHYRN